MTDYENGDLRSDQNPMFEMWSKDQILFLKKDLIWSEIFRLIMFIIFAPNEKVNYNKLLASEFFN